MFVLSFKNAKNIATRLSLDKCCISLEEIKDFNELIHNKLSFDQPIKNKQEAHEKLVEMSRNGGYVETYQIVSTIKNIRNSFV